MTELSRGKRFYRVRLALGDGVRKPESLRRFSDRVYAATGVRIHPSELSEIENDKPSKAVTVDHVEAVDAVDPLHRGKLWLGWGEGVIVPSEEPLQRGTLTAERIEAAREAARARAAADTADDDGPERRAAGEGRRRPARRPKRK